MVVSLSSGQIYTIPAQFIRNGDKTEANPHNKARDNNRNQGLDYRATVKVLS